MTASAEAPAIAGKLKLKRIPYRGINDLPENDGILDYVIFPDNRCVFSGITKGGSGTINAAENVLAVISAREHIPLAQLRFFDLQTCRGYSSFGVEQFSFVPLVFTVDQGENIRNVGWDANQTPEPEILDLFREHIGTITFPVMNYADAVAQGFRPTFFGMADDPQGSLASFREFHRCIEPEVLATLVIVDLSTDPDYGAAEESHRYEVYKRQPQVEMREDGFQLQFLADLRASIETRFKAHRLTRKELADLADTLQSELSCSPDAVPFAQELEYPMRAIAAILRPDSSAHYIWTKLKPGVLDLFVALCQDFQGFFDIVKSDAKSGNQFAQFLVDFCVKSHGM